MDQNTIKTEDFWNPEHIVEKFWNGLKEGKIYGRKCKECGAIEFPPHLACNECGYHETEWTELSGKGKLKSFVFTGILNARLELEDRGLKYVCGEVELEEGPSINAVILGISKKKGREIADKLPLAVKPVFYDMGRYTTLFFELDED
ncbi:MAG: zinc ribbon domain-containing protein [Lachnospiraceae bacterium]|nr:zinc ribbon domain-containing protein [Lachnospiraceae bacterium]